MRVYLAFCGHGSQWSAGWNVRDTVFADGPFFASRLFLLPDWLPTRLARLRKNSAALHGQGQCQRMWRADDVRQTLWRADDVINLQRRQWRLQRQSLLGGGHTGNGGCGETHLRQRHFMGRQPDGSMLNWAKLANFSTNANATGTN